MTRKTPEIVEVDTSQLEELLRRAEDRSFEKDDYATIAHVLESYVYVTGLLRDKKTAISRLRKILFGNATEKTDAVIGSADDSATGGRTNPSAPDSAADAPRKGHGRNGADAYAGGERIDVPHASLEAGEACPDCGQGKVYEVGAPGVLVRVVGQAPLHARVYRLRKFRCHLCGKVFTAEPPPEAGDKKYDATAAGMIALLKYGSGLPFNRLEGLQRNLGIPLPASTQWDVIAAFAPSAAPAYEALIAHAAQGDVLHNDDTTVKILEYMGERAKRQASDGDDASERTGLFTSGVVSTREGRRLALFFSGRRHAGENLADVLRHRADELRDPIQMCDALSRNLPRELRTIVANCLAHARRQFVDVADRFPDECTHVLQSLRIVYRTEAEARKRKLSPDRRLDLHQTRSGPTMTRLRDWLNRRIDEKLVEPNSALGEAVRYMLKHWDRLTLFLRVPGAPLDNNICERALKKAILFRKNSLFYKSQRGARVGDMYMSLIHTCELCRVSPFDYLNALHQNPGPVADAPENWLPWNFRQAAATPSAETA